MLFRSGLATVSESVVAERIVYPADDTGGADYKAEMTVG